MADRPEDAPARRDDTRDPRASRLAALRILYAADVREVDPLDVLQEELEKQGRADDDDLDAASLDRFAVTLLHGLGGSMPEVDARIARFARGWRLERMPAIDRNVLRLAVHELMTEPTPVAVVMDEAVRLASELSTDDSGRYVNGVLAAIVRDLASSAERAIPDTDLPATPALDLDEGPVSPADEIARLGLDLALEAEVEGGSNASVHGGPGEDPGAAEQD
jgi:N utilization substance protein B